MSQNLKIVLTNVDKQTPNNVGFSDTITIKGDSKIALTSFNASFDINNLGQDILGQRFTMNLNESLIDNLKTITVPNKIYFNQYDLDIAVFRAINNSFGAYEPDVILAKRRSYTGYAVVLQHSNSVGQQTGFGITNKEKTSIYLNITPLVKHDITFDPLSNFSVNADGELITIIDDLDLELKYNKSTVGVTFGMLDALGNNMTQNGSLETDTYLAKGGGTCFQYCMRFNNSNGNTSGTMEMSDQNGNTMSLVYKTILAVNNPLVEFFVKIVDNGVETTHPISDDFYNWNTKLNGAGTKPDAGPWTRTQKILTESYFLWYVRDGKWSIVYFDPDLNEYHDVFNGGLNYKIESNYLFKLNFVRVKVGNVVYIDGQTKATLSAGDNTPLSTPLKSVFNFSTAQHLKEIYGFDNECILIPADTAPCNYVPNTETDFYPKQNFELACEIDTIKIKNFVGTKGNVDAGRKNIIAYFTPETSISQSRFIYRFDPSSPIYLSVDSKTDIELNSLNIRFINTFSNRTFSAETITCVLTNSP